MAQRKRNWQVKRQLVSKQYGWQRWDQAYQLLLTIAQPTTQLQKTSAQAQPNEEDTYESG